MEYTIKITKRTPCGNIVRVYNPDGSYRGSFFVQRKHHIPGHCVNIGINAINARYL